MYILSTSAVKNYNENRWTALAVSIILKLMALFGWKVKSQSVHTARIVKNYKNLRSRPG